MLLFLESLLHKWTFLPVTDSASLGMASRGRGGEFISLESSWADEEVSWKTVVLGYMFWLYALSYLEGLPSDLEKSETPLNKCIPTNTLLNTTEGTVFGRKCRSHSAEKTQSGTLRASKSLF